MSQRLQQIARPPWLVTGDAHDAVTEVVVDADNVGEHVMAVVVRVPPLRGQPGHVPLPGGGMNFGIVHPIPLTVADIVAQLHVLDALGRGQRASSDRPSGPGSAGADHDTGAQIEAALNSDVRWIYVRSFAPSESSMSRRIASNSTASASTSAALRWAYSLTSEMAMSSHWSIDGVARAGNGVVVGAGVPATSALDAFAS